jgi:anaerobic magnesium-protoporphyrin IX monomethyl ester cyclase
MRVCLINPPYIHPRFWGMPYILPPLETAYVAAVLEKKHDLRIIDAHIEGWNNVEQLDETRNRIGLRNKEIAARINRWSPDVVGINVRFSGWSSIAYEIASLAKSIDKNIITMLDGLHPSARPKECLMQPDIDFVIIGEPEYTTLELVDTLEQGKSNGLKNVKGIGFKKNGNKIITSPRPLLEDLDALPFPARHLLPMEAYFAAVRKYPLRGEINKRWATMLTSRGCPHNCVFCTSHIVNGRKWRARSPENVVDEIKELVDTYRIKQIDFNDDNMALDKKRMEAICDLIVESGLDIEWYTPNGIRADTLDENLLIKMKKSGCKKIRIAPESGVQRVVNQIIKKNLDLREVEKTVVLCKKVGIKVGCFFVIGLIGETKEDIKESVNFAYRLRRLGADRFYFSIATPMYGTELYEQAKRLGFLKDGFNDEALSSVEPLIETPEFTIQDIRELCTQANLINQKLTFEKVISLLREPRKTIQMLIVKMNWHKKRLV